MNFTSVKSHLNRRYCHIQISKPESSNSLDELLINELQSALLNAQKERSVKVIVLSGEGEHFCNFYDSTYLRSLITVDYTLQQELVQQIGRLYQLMVSCRKPIIALVEGKAFGPGLGILLACDVVFGSSESLYALPEVTMGLVPGYEMMMLAKRIGEGKAKYYAMSGSSFTAHEALQMGCIDSIVSPIELIGKGLMFAEKLAVECNASAVGLIKEFYSRRTGMSPGDVQEFAANLSALSRMSAEAKNSIQSLIDADRNGQ